MQGGGVNFHQSTRGNPESLHLAGVQLAIRNLILLGQQKDEVPDAQIELAVPVVFQAVQLGVVAVAPAHLEGHTAKERSPQRGGFRQVLQRGFLRYIAGAFRQRGGSAQGLDHGLAFGFISGDDTAVRGKLGGSNRIDGHLFFLPFS